MRTGLIYLAGTLAITFTSHAGDIPTASINQITLNVTNFTISISISAQPNRWYALRGYDGPPVGYSGSFPRVRVSDCYFASSSNFILTDIAASLGPSGRTYDVSIYTDGDYCASCATMFCSTVFFRNEVFAPYPFLTSPVISSFELQSTNVLSLTFGEGLYTNTVPVPLDNSDATFFAIFGTNTIPTNVFIDSFHNFETIF
jgi:hypothetical protein